MASHQQLRQSMKLTVPDKKKSRAPIVSMTRTVKDEERTPNSTKGGAGRRSITLAPVIVSVKKKTKRKQKLRSVAHTTPGILEIDSCIGIFGADIPLSRNLGQTLWNRPSISVQIRGIRIAAPVTVPMNTQRNDKQKKKSAESKRHGRQ